MKLAHDEIRARRFRFCYSGVSLFIAGDRKIEIEQRVNYMRSEIIDFLVFQKRKSKSTFFILSTIAYDGVVLNSDR